MSILQFDTLLNYISKQQQHHITDEDYDSIMKIKKSYQMEQAGLFIGGLSLSGANIYYQISRNTRLKGMNYVFSFWPCVAFTFINNTVLNLISDKRGLYYKGQVFDIYSKYEPDILALKYELYIQYSTRV